MRFEEQFVFLVGRFVAGMVIPFLILTVGKRYSVQVRHPMVVYGTCAVLAAAIPFVGVAERGKILLSAYAALFGLVCIFWRFAQTMRDLAIKKAKKRR